MNRRDALRLAAIGGAGLAFGRKAPAQTIPSWPTELKRLAPGMYAYTQASGPGVDNASLSNAGVIEGPDGLLAIDALGPPVHAKAFRATAMTALGKPFRRVINTHHHRDHTNGNCFFTDAEIVAHQFCREATITQGIPPRPYDDRPQWQDGMSELTLAPATTTFTGTKAYRYGDRDVQLISVGPAHTWGDVIVYVPQDRLLFAGDLAFYYVTPPAHNGRITSWISAIDRVLKMDVDIIVPGHGPVGTKRELAETRAYLELLVRELRPRFEAKMSPGRAAADINVGRFAGWTNPERTAWNAVRLFAEFDGTLTPETDLAAQNQAVAEYNSLRRNAG